MIKIEIKEAALTGRKWPDGSTVYEQVGWAFIPEPNGTAPQYPQRTVLRLENKAEPWPVGVYQLLPTSLYVGNFSALTLGIARLQPLQQKTLAAA